MLYSIQLTEEDEDILRELGNIGAGNALTALTQLVGQEVQIALPKIQITTFRHMPEVLGGGDAYYTSVNISFSGELIGTITFVLNEFFTRQVAENLTGEPVEAVDRLNEWQRSALYEMGNIMCNAYLNALAAMLGMRLNVSVPLLGGGRGAAALAGSEAAVCDADQAFLVIENTFHYANQTVKSHILFHPQMESIQKILERLAL